MIFGTLSARFSANNQRNQEKAVVSAGFRCFDIPGRTALLSRRDFVRKRGTRKGLRDLDVSYHLMTSDSMNGNTVGIKSSKAFGRVVGAGSRSPRTNRHRLQPALLELEERRLLSTFIVTDNSDVPTDTGSLRYGVNNEPSGTTIQFASNVTGTITLTNGSLNITKNFDIQGPAPARSRSAATTRAETSPFSRGSQHPSRA